MTVARRVAMITATLLALTSAVQATPVSSISSNFNGTAIRTGDYVWFNSVLKPGALGADPVTIFLTGSTISFTAGGTPFNLTVPNARITLSPSAFTATTSFDAATNTWLTTAPSSGLAGNIFLDGIAFQAPLSGLAGGITGVTWSSFFSTDTPGLSLNWKWGAAVYTSFSTEPSVLGVKPVDDNTASVYVNSDHAGTPENFRSFVTGGATGGGGSNFTGSYSGTAMVTPSPVPEPASLLLLGSGLAGLAPIAYRWRRRMGSPRARKS